MAMPRPERRLGGSSFSENLVINVFFLLATDLLGLAVNPLDLAHCEHRFDSRRSFARRGVYVDTPQGLA